MRQLIILLFHLAFFTSCEELFESTTEIDLPETTDKLVVQSNIDISKDSFEIFITHSQNVSDPTNIDPLEDAIVVLRTSSDQITLTANPDNNISDHVSFQSSQILQAGPGEMLSLEVSHERFESVSSSVEVPKSPKLISAKYTRNSGKDLEGYDIDELILEIEDLDPDENYYQVRAFQLIVDSFVHQVPGQDTIVYVYHRSAVYLQEDGLTTRGGTNRFILFDDGSFNGKTGKIRIQGSYYNPNESDPEITVELAAISRDRFLYSLSVTRAANNAGNPFVEPDNVHTNISNGYGIFSIENSVSIVIPVE